MTKTIRRININETIKPTFNFKKKNFEVFTKKRNFEAFTKDECSKPESYNGKRNFLYRRVAQR